MRRVLWAVTRPLQLLSNALLGTSFGEPAMLFLTGGKKMTEQEAHRISRFLREKAGRPILIAHDSSLRITVVPPGTRPVIDQSMRIGHLRAWTKAVMKEWGGYANSESVAELIEARAKEKALTTVDDLETCWRREIQLVGVPAETIAAVPPFATGGIVKRPSRAVLGDDAPETVIPLDHLRYGTVFSELGLSAQDGMLGEMRCRTRNVIRGLGLESRVTAKEIEERAHEQAHLTGDGFLELWQQELHELTVSGLRGET